MKKIISFLLVLVLIFTVCGCSGVHNEENKDNKDDKVNKDSVSVTSDNTSSQSSSSIYDDGVTFAIFTDAHVGPDKFNNFRVKNAVEWVNNTEEVDFAVFLGDNIHDGRENDEELYRGQLAIFNEIVSEFEKPYYYLKGNHDEIVDEFPEHFVVECGDVAFIGIQILYKKHYNIGASIMRCFPTIEQKELEWLEQTLKKCKGKRIIMGAHFSLVNGDPHFIEPLRPEMSSEETGREAVNFGREKVLELAEQYNVELYFNGHEHNRDVPNGVAGTMIDFNLGSLGGDGVFAVVTVKEKNAIIQIKNTGINGLVKKIDYQFRFDIVK